MQTVPVTIRLPIKQLQIIDSYANSKKISRSAVIKDYLSEITMIIEEKIQKDRLVNACKKIKELSLKDDFDFDAVIEDGLKNDE